MSGDKLYSGIRRSELSVLIKLYPVFRRYMKDRDSSRKNEEKTWSYKREMHGEKAVQKFIELGPTFIKLGQVLSARPDLLPTEYIRAFEKLQDKVDPAPFSEVEPILRSNIKDFDGVFEDFQKEAIFGASLGQVHIATHMGSKVAVKVNRPGVENRIRRDLVVIDRLLDLAKNRMEKFLYISVKNVINDFKYRIFDELDYNKELKNEERIRKNIKNVQNVIIPRPYREISGKQVLVLEYIDGIKITDIESLKKAGLNLSELAFNVDLLFMRMLLRDDIFHADPHPGNISVSPDGSIILYDFGMVGHLDEKTRFSLLSLYNGLVNTDPDEIMDALVDLKALSPVANRAVMRRTMEMAISNMQGKNPEDSEIRELLEIANGVIFEFPFRLPRALVLYMRMSALLEGVCLKLDPDFKFIRVLRQLLYQEGLLDELYRKQMENFVRKSIVSIERGLDVLPLLKRRLEDSEAVTLKKDMKTPASIFLGFILLVSVLEMSKLSFYFYLILALDLLGFAGVMLRNK